MEWRRDGGAVEEEMEGEVKGAVNEREFICLEFKNGMRGKPGGKMEFLELVFEKQ